MSKEMIWNLAKQYAEGNANDKTMIKRMVYFWGNLSDIQKDNLWEKIMQKYLWLCELRYKLRQ